MLKDYWNVHFGNKIFGQPLRDGRKRHEWKVAHGFRKFYETTANTAMRSINVAWTMGHSIGISESYYKSTENEVLKDYLTAVNQLTISNESQINEKRLSNCRKEVLIMSIFLIGITIH